MNWFLSLIIGGVSALVGGCLSVGIASAFISWYRVSDREGASGYVLILITIAGAIVSFPIGLFASRFAPGTPGFLKGLGMGVGAVALVAGVVTLVLRVRADLPPEIDGHSLAVDFEWSDWEPGFPTTERGWDLTKPAPSPPACFEMRFRLRKE